MLRTPEGDPSVLGIRDRIRRQLKEEKAEIFGGVTAGSVSFVAAYEWLVALGMPVPVADIAAARYAAGMAALGQAVVHQEKIAKNVKE